MTTTNSPFVVVGVDGSEQSKQALRWAHYLAEPLGARIRAVAVWHLPPGYGAVAIPQDWHPKEDAQRMLTETVEDVFGGNLPNGMSMIIREGNAAKELIDESKGAAMIVVGSRGHGGFTGLLLGSVSSSVAEHAACPVLVVHGDTLPPDGS